MKIFITGGTGFVGQALCQQLSEHKLTLFVRDINKARDLLGPRVHLINDWTSVTQSHDVVINLAGESIAGERWSDARKETLIDSRINTTHELVNRFDTLQPQLLLSASAVGYYGPQGDHTVTENTPPVDSFSYDLCQRWEAEAMRAATDTRVAIMRFGIILDRNGGALEKMLLPYRLGLGGSMGSGKQWMSWIHRYDVVHLIEQMINNQAEGIYNFTAPHPVTNKDFALTLAGVLNRPAVLKTPGFALKLLLGEMAEELLLTGQKVMPERLIAEGYTFKYPMLAPALKAILNAH